MKRLKPEEEVRQKLLQDMKHRLGFPPEMISVERKLSSMPHLVGLKIPDRRFDIVCFKKYGEEIRPLLVIECKAVPLTKGVIEQVIGYNYYARAPFIAIANQSQIFTGLYSSKEGYHFQEGLLSYERMRNLSE